MKALVYHGRGDIRCDEVSDPKIEDGRDAILKVTACAICGSDLHLMGGFVPEMKSGDVLGHECMGEVVVLGRVDPDLEHQQRDRDREHRIAERLDAARRPQGADLNLLGLAHGTGAGTCPAASRALSLIALTAPVAPAAE